MRISPRDHLVYKLLAEKADNGEPCPNNTQIAMYIGALRLATASDTIKSLERSGLIKTLRSHRQRTIIICATGHQTAPSEIGVSSSAAEASSGQVAEEAAAADGSRRLLVACLRYGKRNDSDLGMGYQNFMAAYDQHVS